MGSPHLRFIRPLTSTQGDRLRSEHYQQWGDFEPMQIPGFVNTGLPGKRSCDTLKHNATVGVQQSFHLTDDIHQIALALDHHPIVDYPDELMNDAEMNVRDIVEQTWTRMAGSSVWLPQQKVYLSVTRVVFSPSRTRTVPKMSFLRGQLFSEEWEHLDNRTITWSGKQFTFPTMFDIPSQWVDDGSMFGPEDPHIVLEHGVDDAEPVIIFNMVGRSSDWKRAMHLYRPFTGVTTILTIKDEERAYEEKDWAPFFIPEEQQQTLLGKLPIPVPGYVRKPNEYVHFVYNFRPLQILKCHMRCGDCEFEYEQDVPGKAFNKHHEEDGNVRGGTNFVPVPIPSSMDIDPRVRVYASFPQTNIAKFCDGHFYRPEFAVMVNIGRQYQLAFISESLDFASAILDLDPGEDRCEKGHILTPNTVARWDTSGSQDVMTMTFSINEESTQVTRLHGLLGLVHRLPQFKTLLKRDGLLKGADADLVSIVASWIGDDIRGCLVESAARFHGNHFGKSDHRDEQQEMDSADELAARLKQIKAEEAQRKKDKLADPKIGQGFEAGGSMFAHPDDGDIMWNPELMGEFEDVEGLNVVGLEFADIVKPNDLKDGLKMEDTLDEPKGGEKKDEQKKEDVKKDGVDIKEPEQEKGDIFNLPKQEEMEKLEHPADAPAPVEKKPEDKAKAVHDHSGHHRYHKQHGRRSTP